MISYLVTSRDEPTTIGRAMEAIINQKNRSSDWELLVCAPDEKTIEAANHIKNAFHDFNISIVQDSGRGKPAALNLLFQKALGDIVILTDGDVWMDEYATEKLLSSFRPKPIGEAEKSHTDGNARMMRSLDYAKPTLEMTEIGLVSGHPIPTNDRNTLLGFWAHILTASAHFRRKTLSSQGMYLDASGYLLAIKKEVLEKALKQKKDGNDKIIGEVIPQNLHVDDSYLSHLANQHGYSITYAPDAIVHVKFPATFSDWMKQKVRSTGGYLQIQHLFPAHAQMRHFLQETMEFFIPLKFVTSPKEFFWLILLYVARLYLWLRIFLFYKVLNHCYSSGWPRVESTK